MSEEPRRELGDGPQRGEAQTLRGQEAPDRPVCLFAMARIAVVAALCRRDSGHVGGLLMLKSFALRLSRPHRRTFCPALGSDPCTGGAGRGKSPCSRAVAHVTAAHKEQESLRVHV